MEKTKDVVEKISNSPVKNQSIAVNEIKEAMNNLLMQIETKKIKPDKRQ